MEIKKSSWHYRLNYIFWHSVSWSMPNLCAYFWKTVLSVLGVLFLSSLIGGLVTVVILSVLDDPYMCVANAIMLLSLISIILVPYSIIGYTRSKFDTDEMEVTPNILKEYHKAFKGKYCPIIKYID